MSRRRPPLTCQWEACGRAPVGFRIVWIASRRFLHWFCRPHQRRWDHGVQRRRAAMVDPEP